MIQIKNKINFIFDFDGTIADSFIIHKNAFEEALKDYDLRFNYADYLGMTTNSVIEEIFNLNKRTIDKYEINLLVKKKRLLANRGFLQDIQPIPGAIEFIKLLECRKTFRLFVASSGSEANVLAGLAKMNILDKFEKILTANDIKNGKPDPEIFLKIIGDYNLEKNETLIIEDAFSGLLAAKNAGIDAVCVDKNLPEAFLEDSFLRLNYFDLLNLLQEV